MAENFHEQYFCAVGACKQVYITPQLKFTWLDSILSNT